MPKIGELPMGSVAEAQSSTMENVGITEVELFNISFKWIVRNFSFRWEKVGELLHSPTFSGGAYKDKTTWKLRMFPQGKANETEGYVGMFLELVRSTKSETLAKFSFSILNTKGEAKNEKVERSGHNFTKQGESWGWGKYIKRDFLLNQANGLLPNDDLTVVCNVWVVADSTDNSKQSETSQLKTLSDDLGHLLTSQRFTDVTLVTDGNKEFKAHKALLAARSTVFAAMFEHNLEGSQNKNRVEIMDVKAEALEGMLKFIYSGKCNNLKEHAHDLLAAANKYASEGVNVLCEEELFLGLTFENAAEVTVFADIQSAGTLKARAFDFIALHAKEVMETRAWESMVSSRPRLIVEAFEIVATQQLSSNHQSKSSAEAN